MDEYLFIELAKLQADRRRLEREQRELLRRSESLELNSAAPAQTPGSAQALAMSAAGECNALATLDHDAPE